MKILFAFFLLLSVGTAYGQSLSPHPVPEEFASDYFVVTVNGQNVPVFHAGLNVYFASFDFTGEAAVTVEANYKTKQYSGQTYNKEVIKISEKGYWGGDVLVRPLSKNVQANLEGLTASFKLSEPGQYSVERVGTSNFKDDALFLFANRPDKPLPKTNNPNLIHLKAGIHHRNIDLKSGQTLYLDPGAVLFGAINVWDAKNVSILGKGTVVYYGPQSETRDDGWKNQKNWHPLTTRNVQGLTVRGITFVCRSRTWSLQTHTTFDAIFDNIKVIAVNPQNINGDGIDWYGGGRTKVINSFIRSMDDCFAFFTPDSSQDMWAINKPTTGSVKDIYIENCVLWTTLANVFRIGFNSQALTTDNITMKNCDVLHISQGNWHAPSSLLCMVSPNSQGKAVHNRYLLENIHFEEPTALLGLQNPESSLSNLHFKGITMLGEAIPSLVNNQIQGVIFEGVFLNGKQVSSAADFPLRTGSKGIEAVFMPKK
ncbi:MAG TPA: hypothetical protein PLC89_16080 [Haliscomenobacter sp.]|uniref:hypothetical protein n=1 Tax=Haliscomenobacter sp. TaxID=2717303 RepID=UPI002BBF8341|nr:hypothetical protein [Haliscomenobacter sp.]HOY18822.1 hypothetical protein [Haliscomenobacter sp.]